MKKKSSQVKPKTMEVRTISIDRGLVVYDQVKLVRIKSKTYNLLIMVDCLPTLGDIEGDVSIVGEHGEEKINQMKGYYINKDNVVSLVVEEEFAC